MRKGLTAIIMSLALAGSLVIAGCSGQPLSTREEGTLGGTALGAGGGALIGAAVGHPLAGAAIGGVLGGGTGYVVGNSMQNTQDQQRTDAGPGAVSNSRKSRISASRSSR